MLSSLDSLPLRFFLSAPTRHVEALTLSGSLPVEDVLTQLCWQLARASSLFNDVVLLACPRAFVDVDLGLSVFFATHTVAGHTHAWLDFDPAFRYPSVICLPFTLTVSSLETLCSQALPPGSCIAINGIPWNRRPYQLEHSDVVVLRTGISLLCTIPLAALEARVDGLSMLLVPQLGPGPRPPLQLLAGEWQPLSQAPPHDLASLHAFWSCTRLGWPVRLDEEVPYQRCLLVGLDMPPLVVPTGTRWAPQDFDINLFYRTHLSPHFGERRWRDSGLVYGDLSVMFDRAIDHAGRRPWLVASETFVDVILKASDGSDLGNWPCPVGWSLRPIHTLGPIGHAALQRSSSPIPVLFHIDPPSGPLVEVSSTDSEPEVQEAPALPSASVLPPSAEAPAVSDAWAIPNPTAEIDLDAVVGQLLEEEEPRARTGDPAFSPFLLQLRSSLARTGFGSAFLPVGRRPASFPSPGSACCPDHTGGFGCIEVWHLGRFRPLFLPHNSTWALAEEVFRHEGIDLQHWFPVPLYPGNTDCMRCVLVPRSCPQGLALAFVLADGVALGEIFLSPSDTACSVAALCGLRPPLTTVSLAGHPWRFPISLQASLSSVGVGAVEGLIALQDTAIFLQQTLAGAQPFPLYPGLEGVDLPVSTRRAWHCIAPPWFNLASAPSGSVVHFFTDGAAGAATAGFSLVAFLAVPSGSWHFQGVWGSSSRAGIFRERAHDSAEAECCGVAAALLWSLSLPPVLGCCIHVDCDFPRMVFDGTWGPAAEAPPVVWLLRHLAHLSETLSRRLRVCSVTGHSAHPWNDLADALAKQFVSTDVASVSPMPWTSVVLSPAFAWAWLLPPSSWHRSLPQAWDVISGTCASPYTRSRSLSAHLASTLGGHSRPCGEWCTLGISLASFNALSLADPGAGVSSVRGTAAQELLQSQFHDRSILLVGVQETRLPTSVSYTTRSHWVACSASSEGQGGCALWVDLRCPYGTDGQGRDLLLSAGHCRALVADSRLLIVRIRAKGLSLLVAVGHSHHSRVSEEVRDAWWDDLARHLRRCAKAEDSLVLLLDANARVGKPVSSGIGSLDADHESANGKRLRELVASFDLCLPSTFACHDGPSSTWLSPTGTESRIDYVALPKDWLPSVARSWVSQDLDTVRAAVDHKPCVVHVAGLRKVAGRLVGRPAVKFTPDPAQFCRWSQGIASIGHVPWHWDADLHLQQISGSLSSLMRKCHLPQNRVPTQPYVTAQVLSLVAFRKHTRSLLLSLQRELRCSLLRSVVEAWRHVRSRSAAPFVDSASFIHVRIACGIRALQLSSRELRAMLRSAKADYIHRLARDFQFASHHGSARELYAALYKLHPAARKKSSLRPLLQVRGQAGELLLDDDAVALRWAQHWADIEGGQVQDVSALVSDYDLYVQSRKLPHHDWQQLPTRGQWESRFYHLDHRKAAGTDGLSHIPLLTLTGLVLLPCPFPLLSRWRCMRTSPCVGGAALAFLCIRRGTPLSAAIIDPFWSVSFWLSVIILGCALP